MKRHQLLIASIAFISCASLNAQNELKPKTQFLDVNDISVPISSGNLIMFRGDSLDKHYSYPKANPKTIIASSSLWFGAKHNDTLHVSAQLYGQAGHDFHAGPLKMFTAMSDSISQLKYNRVWKINRAEIEDFKTNYKKPGYVIPQIIKDWPGNGGDNELSKLANFVDLNNDSRYKPEDGDYPKIMGDQMIFWIVNDRTQETLNGVGRETGGKPLGLEIHCYAYAFQCNDKNNDSAVILNRTTFYHFDIINLSIREYDSFVMGVFVDADLGNFSDDYSGSFIKDDLGFMYNGDDDDEGPKGFGINANRLSVGTQFLNHKMEYFIQFENNNSTIYGNPNKPADYYNYLQAKYKNGADLIVKDSNGVVVNSDFNWFAPFDSLTAGQKPWLSNGIPLGSNITQSDKRYVQSVYLGKVLPGEINMLDYAVIFGELALNSPVALTKIAPMVKNWFTQQQFPSCLDFNQILENKEVKVIDDLLKVYPNPNKGSFTVKVGAGFNEGLLQVFNSESRVVVQQSINEHETKIQNKNLVAGLYIVRIINGSNMLQAKIIVE